MLIVVVCFERVRPSPVKWWLQSEFHHLDARQCRLWTRSESKWWLLQQCSVEARSTALKCENKKCISLVFWNTVNFVGFSVIHVLQGSVATYVRCCGMSTSHCIANFLLSLAVKEFLKSVKIWQSYGQNLGASFFWNTVYINFHHVLQLVSLLQSLRQLWIRSHFLKSFSLSAGIMLIRTVTKLR